MKKIKFLIIILSLFFCQALSQKIFAQDNDSSEEEIAIVFLKGGQVSKYGEQLSKTVNEQLDKKLKIKVLNYDTLLVNIDRGKINFYKSSSFDKNSSPLYDNPSLIDIDNDDIDIFDSSVVKNNGDSLKEITITILKGDILADYGEQISKAIKEKFNLKTKIKVLDYDTFLIDVARDNSNFYKGSPLTYVLSLSKTVMLKSVYKIDGKWQTDYTPVIIARKDRGINTIQDLQNKKFYFTNPNSASGYLYPKLFLIENNVKTEKEFFNDSSPSAEDVYNYVISGKWDACCNFYGLFKDDPLFKKNDSIKIFEIDYKIPNDPLWVDDEFKQQYPQLTNDIANLILDLFKDNEFVSFAKAQDSDYNDIRIKVRILGIIKNKDFVSVDTFLGLFTKNPKILDFVLKYSLHIILVNLIFVAIIIIIVYIIFKKTIVKKYYSEHKLLNDKYNDLLKHLKEENDFNLKITKLENKIKDAFKGFDKFIQDSVMIKYVATGEFLYNKYKDTNAMEPSAIANCYVKAFERIVMVSAYGFETFEKQDEVKVPDEQQNIKNKLDPKKILDNGIRDIREKANLNNREYKSLQKCKSIRNKVAHLKPVSTEEVVSIRKTLLGEIPYTNGILAKLAPYL